MAKIQELEQKRSSIIEKMDALSKLDMNDTQRSEWDSYDKEVKTLSEDIQRQRKTEEHVKSLYKEEVRKEKIEEVKDKTLIERWVEAFKRYATRGVVDDEFVPKDGKGILVPKELRADPILTTTNPAMINKVVGPVSVKTPGGEDWLRAINATFDENLDGNYSLPSIATVTAGYVSEGGDTSTFNVTPVSIILASRILGGNQAISRQTLSQTNPEILQGILKVIDRAMGTAKVLDAFTQMAVDASTRLSTVNATSATFDVVLNMDSSIKIEMQNPVLAFNKSVANYWKKYNVGSANIKFALEDGEMNGYPVFIHPELPANRMYQFDATDLHIGTFGSTPKILIIDEYAKKASGKIEFQILEESDNGYANPASIVIADVSASL